MRPSRHRFRGTWPLVVCLAAVVGTGCEGPRPPAARFWTLFDIKASGITGERIAAGGIFPDGIAATALVSGMGMPITSYAANIANAYSEGGQAAYLTTEVWSRYDAVWTQPMYVLVTAWDADRPNAHLLGADPIFSVGRASTFYSPYWQVFYVVVPEGTSLTRYTSARQILEAGLEMHPGPGKICSLQPHELQIAGGPEAMRVRPHFLDVIGKVKVDVNGWLDGKRVWFMDFGNDRFRWNERDEVVETPLYVFARRDEAGRRVPIGLPNVGGAGGRAAFGPLGQPAFGALWRAHTALLPLKPDGTPKAGVFVPAKFASLGEKLEGVQVPPIAAAIEARADVNDYLLRVALDPTCFADPIRFSDPDGCQWLDSQAAIESNLGPSAIVRGEVLLSCPMVTFAGKPVANP